MYSTILCLDSKPLQLRWRTGHSIDVLIYALYMHTITVTHSMIDDSFYSDIYNLAIILMVGVRIYLSTITSISARKTIKLVLGWLDLFGKI